MIQTRSLLARLVRSACAAVVIFAAAFSLSAADSAAAYARWIKPWAERPATSPALAGTGLMLVVSTVHGEVDEAAVAAMTPLERLNLSYHLKVAATEVGTNGSCRSYLAANTSPRMSAPRQLSAENFEKLGQLLAQLPADNSQLPPAGQRVVVQVLAAGQWHVRVFDGNNLPPEVKALLDLLANPYDKFL